MLEGVDVSGYQSSDFDFTPYDFAIVKATEGQGVVSQGYPAQANKCVSQGKLLGLYHYARPEYNDALTEARFFVTTVRPFIGKALFALDWEGVALDYPVSWVKQWLDAVFDETGVRPLLYTGRSAANNSKWTEIAKTYPLWIAQWGVSKPDSTAWKDWLVWQYRGDPLDLDRFNGGKWEWENWTGSNVSTSWIAGNRFLSRAEMENNARLIWKYFQAKGWSLQAVCGMLGNMQSESTINPGIWENLQPWPANPQYRGMGLVGWTPYTRITNWLQQHGYAVDSGPGQLEKLQEEMEHPEIEVTWIATSMYNFSFKEFSISTMSPEYLGLAFLANYERPANPNQPQRGKQALEWFSFLQGTPVFTPRLNSNNINGNRLWYSNENPFYAAGYGLPNCTCYVWGRRWEIDGVRPTNLPLGNGNTWWERGVAAGLRHGQTPELGAIICTWYANGGHVAVVEQINADGSIVTSNSGWPSTFFWIETLYPPNYLASWMPSEAYVQGFLYLDSSPTGPGVKPPEPSWGFGEEPMKMVYYPKLF